MDTTIALPADLVKTFLLGEVRRAPIQSLSSASPDKLERWVQALGHWRKTWIALETQPEHAKAILADPDFWQAAIQAVKPWNYSSAQGRGWERAGDWNDEGDSGYIDLVAAEREQWRLAGWHSVSQAHSSSEWVALMLLEMEKRFGVVVSQQDWEQRVQEAFERDSGAVMAQLLEHYPHRAAGARLTELPETKAYETEPDRPLGHRLFDAQHLQASLALAKHRPLEIRALVNAPDALGRTPLSRQNTTDPVRVDQLLKYGADPMARDHRHRLPEEVAFQNVGPAVTAADFHAALNSFRTVADQAVARRQWLAAMSTSCSWSLLKEMGLTAEVQALIHVDVAGQPGTLLDYMDAFGDNRTSRKERLAVLCNLVKGTKGRDLLMAHGSVDEGLARFFSLVLNHSAQDIAERTSMIQESVVARLKPILSDPGRLGEMLHRTFELCRPLYLDSLNAFIGSMGIFGKTDLESLAWEPARLEQLRKGLLRSAVYPRNGTVSGQDLTRWTNAAKWTVAWTQDMEGDPLLQRRWLPCVLATASAVTDATLKQSLEDRAVGWMVANVEPEWEDPQQGESIMARVESTLAHVMAKVRQQRMDQQFEPAVRRAGPRL